MISGSWMLIPSIALVFCLLTLLSCPFVQEQSVQYWPEEGCAKFGKLRVTKIDEEVLDDHTQRVFKVRSHGVGIE